MNYRLLNTPIGRLRLVSAGAQLAAIEFEGKYTDDTTQEKDDAVLRATAKQLTEYFARRRKTFDLPLGPNGTEFQRLVWQALQDIPYGEMRSYRDIARAIDRGKCCGRFSSVEMKNRQ